MSLKVCPLTIKQSNELVRKWHRHHKPVVGYRFAIGVLDEDGDLHGAAIVGRPVSRELEQYGIAEVTRLVTDGHKHACSFLYAACARIAREMGFQRIQTYILDTEPGTSLLAAGWTLVRKTNEGNWNNSWRKGRREDQPMTQKQRWEKIFNLGYIGIARERIARVEAQSQLFERGNERQALQPSLNL